MTTVDDVYVWRAGQRAYAVVPRGKSWWRAEAARVIENALAGIEIHDEQELREVLFAAYPFGERERWPYKCWLAEQRRAISKWEATA